jgi:hypothetical protein
MGALLPQKNTKENFFLHCKGGAFLEEETTSSVIYGTKRFFFRGGEEKFF